MTTQAERDAVALAQIGDIAWAALKDTSIPNGQIAEATGAIIGVLGEAYMKDRAKYLTFDMDTQASVDATGTTYAARVTGPKTLDAP